MSEIKEVKSYGTQVVSWRAGTAFFECPHCGKHARVFVDRGVNMFGKFTGAVAGCDKCGGKVRFT